MSDYERSGFESRSTRLTILIRWNQFELFKVFSIPFIFVLLIYFLFKSSEFFFK